MASKNIDLGYLDSLLMEALPYALSKEDAERFLKLADKQLDSADKDYLRIVEEHLKEFAYKAIDDFSFAKLAKKVLKSSFDEDELLDGMIHMEFAGSVILYGFDYSNTNPFLEALKNKLTTYEFEIMYNWDEVLKSLNKNKELLHITQSTELSTSEKISRFDEWWQNNTTAQELERALNKAKGIIKGVIEAHSFTELFEVEQENKAQTGSTQVDLPKNQVATQTNEVAQQHNASNWFKEHFQQLKSEVDDALNAYNESIQKLINLQKGE